MTRDEAIKLVQTPRGRGRPKPELSAQLAEARIVLGLAEDTPLSLVKIENGEVKLSPKKAVKPEAPVSVAETPPVAPKGPDLPASVFDKLDTLPPEFTPRA